MSRRYGGHPAKFGREDTKLQSRLMSILAGGSLAYLGINHWYNKFRTTQKSIMRDLGLNPNAKKLIRAMFKTIGMNGEPTALSNSPNMLMQSDPNFYQDMIESTYKVEKTVLRQGDIKEIRRLEGLIIRTRTQATKQIDRLKRVSKKFLDRLPTDMKNKYREKFSTNLDKLKDNLNVRTMEDKARDITLQGKNLTNDVFSNIEVLDYDTIMKYKKNLLAGLESEHHVLGRVKNIIRSIGKQNILKVGTHSYGGDADLPGILNRIDAQEILTQQGIDGILADRQSDTFHQLTMPHAATKFYDIREAYDKIDIDSRAEKSSEIMNGYRNLRRGQTIAMEGEMLNRYRKALNERYLPNWTYKFVSTNPVEQVAFRKVFHSMGVANFNDPVSTFLHQLKTVVGKGDKFEVGDVSVRPIEMTGSTRWDIKVKFRAALAGATGTQGRSLGISAADREYKELIFPLITSKEGFIQTDPSSIVRRFSALALRGKGIEAHQLDFYSHRIFDAFDKALEYEKGSNLGQMLDHVKGVQSKLEGDFRRSFDAAEIASLNPAENLNAMFQTQHSEIRAKDIMSTSGYHKGVETVRQLGESVEVYGAGKYMTYLDTEYADLPGKERYMQSITAVVVRKNEKGIWELHEEYTANISDNRSIYSRGKINYDDSTYFFKNRLYKKSGESGKTTSGSINVKDALKHVSNLLGSYGPILGANTRNADINTLMIEMNRLAKSTTDKKLAAEFENLFLSYRAFYSQKQFKTVFDVNDMKLITNELKVGGFKGEHIERMIDDNLEYLINTSPRDYGIANSSLNNLWKSVLGVTRTMYLNEYARTPLTHQADYDAISTGSFGMLSLENAGKETKYRTFLAQKLTSALKRQKVIADGGMFPESIMVSQGKHLKGMSTLFDLRTMLVGFDYYSQSRSYNQILTGISQSNNYGGYLFSNYVKSKGMPVDATMVPRVLFAGMDDAMEGISPYVRYQHQLLLDSPMLADQHEILSRAFVNKHMAYEMEPPIYVDRINPALNRRGATVPKNEPIGWNLTSGGGVASDIIYERVRDGVVMEEPVFENGKWKILIAHKTGSRLGRSSIGAMGKTSAKSIESVGNNIDSLVRPDAFLKRQEAGPMLSVYLGQLANLAEGDNEFKIRLMRAVNKSTGLRKYISAVRTHDTGAVQFVMRPQHRDLDYLFLDGKHGTEPGLFPLLGDLYRTLHLTQNQYKGYWKNPKNPLNLLNTVFTSNSAQFNPNTIANRREVYNATRLYILKYSTGDFAGGATEEVLKSMMLGAGYVRSKMKPHETFRTAQTRLWKSFISKISDRNFNAVSTKETAEIFSMLGGALPMVRGELEGNKLSLGFASIMPRVEVSDQPLFGLGQPAKMSLVVLEMLKDRPGSQKMVEGFAREMLKQSYGRLGELNVTLEAARNGLPDFIYKNYTDYMDLVKRGEKDISGKSYQELADRLLSNRPSAARIFDKMNMDLYEFEGQIKTWADMRDLFPSSDIQQYKINANDLRGRAVLTRDLEFMERLGPIFMRVNPDVDGQFVDPTNPKNLLRIEHQIHKNNGSYFIRTPNPNISILSQDALTEINQMTLIQHGSGKRLPGFHKTIEDWINRKVDLGFKSNYYMKAPRSFMAQLQHGNPILSDTWTADQVAKNNLLDSVMAAEVRINPKWIGNPARDMAAAVEDYSADDIKFLVKYMKEYSQTMFNGKTSKNVITEHPNMALLRDKSIDFDGKPLSVDTFFNNIMQRGIKRNELKKYTDAWKQIVGNPGTPMPIFIGRNPMFGPKTGVTAIGFFNDPAAPMRGSTLKKPFAFMSQLISGFLGADYDADTGAIALAPEGWREQLVAEINEGIYSEKRAITGIGARYKDGKYDYQVFDPERGGIIHVDEQEYYKTFDDSIREYIAKRKGLTTEPGLENLSGWLSNKEHAAHMKRFTKITPGLSFKFVTSMHLMTDVLKDHGVAIKRNEAEGIFGQLGRVIEWGLKTKSGTQHPGIFAINDLINISDDEAYRRVETLMDAYKNRKAIMNNKIFPAPIDYPGMEGVVGDNNEMGGGFMYQVTGKNVNDLSTLHEIYNTKVSGALKDFINNSGVVKGKTDPVLGDLIRTIGGLDPTVLKYGPDVYKMYSRATNMARLMTMAHGGIKFPFNVDQLVNITQFSTPHTNTEGFFKSLGRNLSRGVDKKTLQKFSTAGSAAGSIALAAFAINLFRPDQVKSLGHMPGRGGEYWDYTSANNEMDYTQFMQSPIGNPYDLPKAYLHLFGPEDFEIKVKSSIRNKNNRISHGLSNIRGHHSRAMYLNSSAYSGSGIGKLLNNLSY